MNKKIIALTAAIIGLFIITVIIAVISSGVPKSKTRSFIRTDKRGAPPLIEKESPPAESGTVSSDIEKEYEPPVKGPLLN